MNGWFDHNATTPLEPRVLEAMRPWLERHHGNASSLHRAGRLARNAIDEARAAVAALVGAHPTQIVFTSGGTEANNLALKGAVARHRSGRLLVSAAEHSAVLEPARALTRAGFAVELLPVDASCRLKLDALEERLDADVRLVSVMLANNETGVLQDTAAVARLARRHGAIYHCDAVQALGKLPVDFAATGAHLMTLSAHKIYGPKGIGALVFDRALELAPLVEGGAQEQGLRGGTENVAGIVGFGAAAALAAAELGSRIERLTSLRARLERGLRALPGAVLFGFDAPRLPNTVQFALPGIDGEALLMGLDRQGFAVSTGSACKSGQPSHVLAAMGVAEPLARSAIRVSLGKDNTADDVDGLLAALAKVTGALPVAAMHS